jgi:hypothetical protein
MGHSARYLPKLGDEVTVLGQKGLFVVIAVRTEPESVDSKFSGPQEFILRNTSWRTLKPTKNVRWDVTPARDTS